MPSRRVERAQDLIKEEVARLLLFKVKDPRVGSVTITSVQMTGDLKRALIQYAILGDREERAEVQTGLEKASGFIRREIGQALRLKFVPEIEFRYDHGLRHARHMDEVFKNLDVSREPEES
jgi:ribosome-binding factor A